MQLKSCNPPNPLRSQYFDSELDEPTARRVKSERTFDTTSGWIFYFNQHMDIYLLQLLLEAELVAVTALLLAAVNGAQMKARIAPDDERASSSS
jgi:hypothetical protein